MQASRFATLFNLRYAGRVLERHARLWRRIDGAVRLAALMAGSSAIAALGAQNQSAAIGLGLVFAALQAVEFALRPADAAARAMAMRRQYAQLLAREARLDGAALSEAYAELVAADDIVVSEALRRLAYNDVAQERGCDAAHLYGLDRWQRLVARLA